MSRPVAIRLLVGHGFTSIRKTELTGEVRSPTPIHSQELMGCAKREESGQATPCP